MQSWSEKSSVELKILQLTVQSDSQMNNAITCTGCSKPFESHNLPRIANCLHTYCQYCLTRLHACPMDKEPFAIGPGGLSEFPLNRTIAKIVGLPIPEPAPPISASMNYSVYAPVSQAPAVVAQPRLSEDPHSNMCLLHRKEADLVCIDHGIRICSNCALFGEHKLHQIKTVDNVVEECTTVAEQTVAIMSEVKGIQDKVSVGTVTTTLEQAFREKRQSMAKAIRMRFSKVMDRLRKAQDTALEELTSMLEAEKEGLKSNLKIEELEGKKKDWFREAADLCELMDSVSSKKKIQEATVYLNDKYEQSRIVKNGQYLIVEINSTEKLLFDKITASVDDFNYETENELQDKIDVFCKVFRTSQRNRPSEQQAPKTDRVDDEFLLEELNKMHISDSNEMNNSNFSQNVLEIPVLSIDKLDISTPSWNQKSQRCNQKSFIKERQHQHQPLTQVSNNDAKRKKKLKIPEKYEAIVQDLRCDRTDCIDLTNAELGDAIIISLCDYIRNTSKLRTLKLIRNKLTDEAFSHILDACGESKVTSLNLGQNLLTDKALDIASKCELKDLRNITLSQNRLNQRNSKNKVAEFKKLGITISL